MSEPLAEILARKEREIARRSRRARREATLPVAFEPSRLRRLAGEPIHVIAEIKHASPSAGLLRRRVPGGVEAIARAYEANGATVVSVLSDGPGFGGTPLDVRRARRAVSLPVLFKEFVLDEVQLDLAVSMGASLVLLLVRALTRARLDALVRGALSRGLAPVVEAADARELEAACLTEAAIVGVNARDLRTFRVDPVGARTLVENVPRGRIAVYMSGVETREHLEQVAGGRADAVLIGSALMRAADPGVALASLLRPSTPAMGRGA